MMMPLHPITEAYISSVAVPSSVLAVPFSLILIYYYGIKSADTVYVIAY